MEICCIFFSINARSSAVTGTRSTMLLVRFAIRSPSFPFPIRVWDYPNKQTRRHPAGRAGALFGSVATLPMLAAVSPFLLLLRLTPCVFPNRYEKLRKIQKSGVEKSKTMCYNYYVYLCPDEKTLDKISILQRDIPLLVTQ